MEIFALRAYAAGYRGCLIDNEAYVFFQYTRKGKCKRLKDYPRTDFEDNDHFAAMMMKFMGPSAFLRPPIPIDGLTLAELDRVHALVRKRTALNPR
ncbi:MAG: hypothetical protein C4519_10050 [Desulfobacteraceae bacterium]|nr:MAG: hypothetical protein C4519_10050 [Desulfobacteraceae bacterium]